MAHIISVTNQKGGVGKTTTINVAASLAAIHKRVLLIDLDPQANATSGSGLSSDLLTCHHLFHEQVALTQIIKPSKFGYHVLPANYSLTQCDIKLMSHPRKAFFLKNALSPLMEDYDFILIDCPPALNNLTLNASLRTLAHRSCPM